MKYVQQANKAYVQIAISLGFAHVDKVLEGTKLDEQALSVIDAVDMVDAIKIVSNMNRYSMNPNWAAVLGNHLGIATHGPVGYAAISAPTVGKALSTFVTWFQIRSECYTSKVIELDEAFEITVVDTTGDKLFKSFFFEAYVRAFEVLVALLIGRSAAMKTEIFFESIAKERQSSIQAEYDSILHFDAGENKFVIPKAMWYLPSPLSDPDSHQLNLHKCKQLMEQVDLSSRIDLIVQNRLRQYFDNKRAHDHYDEHLPTLKSISELMHQSERTLTRKLNKLGMTYKGILQEERKQCADKLLKDGRFTVIHISHLLGYNETSSFCRAFKVWFGMKPSEYRRNPPL